MTAPKTPGIYLELQHKLPAVIVQPPTAVPAFIGYTELTVSAGKSLINIPRHIHSLSEYEGLFGGPPAERRWTLSLDETANYRLLTFRATDQASVYYWKLYDSLRLYFDNGGGECYVVSVGSYADTPVPGDPVNPTASPGFRTGLQALRKTDGPSLILFPDAVLLNDERLYHLQNEALAHCADLQDRFCLFDLFQAPDHATAVSDFRDGTGVNHLSYGAAFTPWLRHTYPVPLSYRYLSFENKSGQSLSMATLTLNPNWKKLITDMEEAISDRDKIITALSTGGVSVPSLDLEGHYAGLVAAYAQAVSDANLTAIKTTFRNLLDWISALLLLPPVWATPGTNPPQNLRSGKMLHFVHGLAARGLAALAEAYIRLLRHPDIEQFIYDGSPAADFSPFDATRWLSADAAGLSHDPGLDLGIGIADTAAAAFVIVETIVTPAPTSQSAPLTAQIRKVLDAARAHETEVQDRLYEQHPILSTVITELRSRLALIPPSGAVAGAMVKTDRNIGVWKAPANIPLESISGPSVYLDNATQDGLNVDPDSGKSVNAIRAFPGRGNLIFGSRTLRGNDPEWRYIPVRRLFITVEKALSTALSGIVFEPNDLNTWVRLRVLINGYLSELWRAGALRGLSPREAYEIKVGLGETMTPQDVLEGRIIIELGLAAVRPAEFIQLKFTFLIQETIQ